MKTDFKVAEVQLTYKNRIPCKDRQQITGSGTAYHIVKAQFPDETIDYRESFKVIYMNRSNHVLGCLTVSEGGPCSTAVDVKLISLMSHIQQIPLFLYITLSPILYFNTVLISPILHPCLSHYLNCVYYIIF